MAGLVVREPRAEDGDAVRDLLARALARGELAASSDPHGTFVTRYAMSGPGVAVVAELDGALAGLLLPEIKVAIVEPPLRRRGIGTALVDAALLLERARGREALILGVLPDDAASQAFLRATRFAFHSSVVDMELGREVEVAPPAWPEGFRAVPFDHRVDIPRWAALFNAAFASHPTPMVMDPEAAARDWEASPASDDDFAVLVDGNGEPAAFCATDPPPRADGAPGDTGEIWAVGVRPDLQGRGLGRQLLRWGVGHLRALGVPRIALTVNVLNPAALRLYESEGFTATATRDRWARPVPPA